MLEIHVNVGRFASLGRDEPLEQKRMFGRIDFGDAQTKADGGIGRRAAPLTQDSAPPRKAHDVMHGEKIGGIAQLRDDGEFVLYRGLHRGRRPVRVTGARALPCECLQRLLLAGEALAQFIGIIVAEIIEAEGEALREAQSLRDGLRRLLENARHFARGFQMPLGVDMQQAPGLVDGRPLADACHHIGQRAPLRAVHHHVIGGEQGQAQLSRQSHARRQIAAHMHAIEHGGRQPHAPARRLRQRQNARGGLRLVDQFRRLMAGGGHHGETQALAEVEHIFKAQQARALLRAQIAAREQPRQPPPGRAILGIGEHVGRAVAEHQPRAAEIAEIPGLFAVLAQIDMGAHHARHRIAVGEADPVQPQRDGLRHQLLGMGGAAQEGEIAGDAELDEACHGVTQTAPA